MLRQFSKSLMHMGLACLILSAGWLAGSTQAATIIGTPKLLSELAGVNGLGVPGATISSGDKLFEKFTYLATGDMPPTTGINVVPIQDDAGNYGIRFQGAFTDLASSPGGSDALINYDVTATAPGKLISDAHLAGNPNLLGTTGSVNVTETFNPLDPPADYTRIMEIYDDEQNPNDPKLSDVTFFTPPQKTLHVQKDIQIFAGNQTSTLSFVDQTFSQIPEATTITLALISLVSLAGFRRRSVK